MDFTVAPDAIDTARRFDATDVVIGVPIGVEAGTDGRFSSDHLNATDFFVKERGGLQIFDPQIDVPDPARPKAYRFHESTPLLDQTGGESAADELDHYIQFVGCAS